jgi:type I site-specific restriction-modification system R (restriction) subunit
MSTAPAIETAQVIEELIGLAKDVRQTERRGADLGLSGDELASYDALEANDSAVKVLGEPTLRDIARELAGMVRRNVTIRLDSAKERARAASSAGQTHPPETWLPAGQAG